MSRDFLSMGKKADSFRWITGIEDTFIGQVSSGKRRLDEYELTQHYFFWREDIDLIKKTGFEMSRYGIPWYRVNPAKNTYDWSWVDEVLDYMVNVNNIIPIIDLMHYGTPLWLENSFINPDYPRKVAEYAREFASRYDFIDYFTPLNEPYINAKFCGSTAFWPPYLSGDSGFIQVMKNLCKGIIYTVREIKNVNPQARMVHVEATGEYITEDNSLEERLKFEKTNHFLMFDLITGRVNQEHYLYNFLVKNGFSREDFKWFENNQIELDIIGLNYYPELSVYKLFKKDKGIKKELIPGGTKELSNIIKSYYHRYNCPVVITETSTNASVEERIKWLHQSVEMVKEIRNEGIPLIGYTWWPLFDLVNWDYMEGNNPVEDYLETMGLWSLEPQFNGVLKRVRTKAVDEFIKIANNDKQNTIGDIY